MIPHKIFWSKWGHNLLRQMHWRYSLHLFIHILPFAYSKTNGIDISQASHLLLIYSSEHDRSISTQSIYIYLYLFDLAYANSKLNAYLHWSIEAKNMESPCESTMKCNSFNILYISLYWHITAVYYVMSLVDITGILSFFCTNANISLYN